MQPLKYYCPKNVNEIAHTSLVWPKLQYVSAAWDLFLNKDISALERVQWKAKQFCTQNYNRYARVAGMIKDLGCAMLMRRRESTLTLMHGLIDEDSGEYLIPHFNSHTRGSHQSTFHVPYANKDFFSKTYSGLELPPSGHCFANLLRNFSI